MSSHHAQEPMDLGDMEPKHSVFWCHSGAQKGFVEQLDKDLRSAGQNPFFDKDRESLPIGDYFPTLIFQAIERCNVGVVFLSEEFFMRSHWPMIELVKMVECERGVMPIFLGISPGDLSNKEKVVKWKLKWEAWAKVNGRIDVAKWESTLRFLRPLNGLVYNDAVGEVKFREEIVKEVCKIVPSFHVWDDSHVQAMSRICKVIKEKLTNTARSEKGAQVVGLYGVGGIGKTTACKCLCTDLALEFDGRVCRIEFGDGTSEIDRVREVLKRLTSSNNEFLKDKNLDECWVQLKCQLRSKKVVLAIDNVSSKSSICDEARKYLRLEYGKGSIVMVTARALGELENLGLKMDNCLAMPELVEEEARALFLYHVGSKNEVDEKVVMECIRRCYFGKGDGIGSKHYHPLALKVLGSQLVGRHPMEWKLQLEAEDVFNQRREDENPVFSILETSFEALTSEDQMLFMDVALFDDADGGYSTNFLPHQWLLGRYGEYLIVYTIFEWLSMIHGIRVDRVIERLNELKRKSLLENLGDGTGQIGMHDLWREFAVMKAKHAKEGNSKWVYEDFDAGGEGSAESCMSSGGWRSLCRICIKKGSIKSISFSECSEVRALRLEKVYVEDGVLDLSCFKLIKSLEIHHQDMKIPDNVGDVEQQVVSGIGQLLNLRILSWFYIDVSLVEEIFYLTNLQVLHLSSGKSATGNSCMSLDLQQLRYLKDVRVQLSNMVSISGFNSKMKELRILVLKNCHGLRRCMGVGDVDSLEALSLNRCNALEELPNLQKLRRLRRLNITFCDLLETLPGLGSLVALRELRACCGGVKELPCMSNLAKLEILDLCGCCVLKCFQGLSNLVALRELVVNSHCLQDLPDLGNLLSLKVEIWDVNVDSEKDSKRGCQVSQNVMNLAMLESVSTLAIQDVQREVTNLCKLTALKSLDFGRCAFERLPRMGRDMRLESLMVTRCARLRGLDSMWGLGWRPHFQVDWTLSNLKKLDVNYCHVLEVIDLSHFPQLRSLFLFYTGTNPGFVLQCHANHLQLNTMIFRAVNIKELPDLRKFPSLQCIEITSGGNLTCLTISEPLPTLSRVVLHVCKKLCTVPNINLIPELTYFGFHDCGVQLNTHEVQKLEARGFQDNGLGTFLLCPSRNVALPSALLSRTVPNCFANEEVIVDALIDLDAVLEPCTSKFIPYDESLSEFGRSPIPKRALEVGSSSGSDQEHNKKLKNN